LIVVLHRFNITYWPGKDEENLSQQEIESVGFKYADIDEITAKYDTKTLKEGINIMDDGEKIIVDGGYAAMTIYHLWNNHE
jgi:hypothetical protein